MIKTVISIMKEKNDKSTVPGIQRDLIFTEERSVWTATSCVWGWLNNITLWTLK